MLTEDANYKLTQEAEYYIYPSELSQFGFPQGFKIWQKHKEKGPKIWLDLRVELSIFQTIITFLWQRGWISGFTWADGADRLVTGAHISHVSG